MDQDLTSDVMIELHVPDFGLTKEFYGEIGYETVWEKVAVGDKGYLVMRSGSSVLNFYCGTDQVYSHDYFGKFPEETPRGFGVEIIMPVDNIEDFYGKFEEILASNIIKPLNANHSHRDFRAVDPFGFYLRFVERYNWVDNRNSDGTEKTHEK